MHFHFVTISRSSGVAKTILQGTVTKKKRWEDNIKESTGVEFVSSTRAAENRTRWKEIVANSSVHGAPTTITFIIWL